MNCSTVFPLTGKRNEVRWGFARVFSFYPKGSKECSRSVVVPVWSKSLQVAVHVFGKYSDRLPHMTVQAHSASHKFHDINARWLLAILPVKFDKKKLGTRFSVCCVQISHEGGEITREDDRENVTTLP